MKKYIPLIFAFLFCVAEARNWTDTEGRTIQADLVEVVDDETVKIKRVDTQRVYTLKTEDLSQADQEYVQSAKAEQAAAEKKKMLAERKAGWTEDYEEAVEEAEKYGLPIYMLFTGSDWCGFCIKLEEGVLSEKEFKEYANENLVLLKLDFPRRKKQDKDTKEQNAELNRKFGVRGFPTVWLADAKGNKIASFVGYGGESPKEYVKKLEGKLGSE